MADAADAPPAGEALAAEADAEAAADAGGGQPLGEDALEDAANPPMDPADGEAALPLEGDGALPLDEGGGRGTRGERMPRGRHSGRVGRPRR